MGLHNFNVLQLFSLEYSYGRTTLVQSVILGPWNDYFSMVHVRQMWLPILRIHFNNYFRELSKYASASDEIQREDPQFDSHYTEEFGYNHKKSSICFTHNYLSSYSATCTNIGLRICTAVYDKLYTPRIHVG